MIITDDFVFLNFPKTGSTFLRNTFKKIHHCKGNRSSEQTTGISDSGKALTVFKAPNIRAYGVNGRWMKNDEHGLRCQIPEKHRHKPIFSVRRNLFKQLVSLYEYRDWAKTNIEQGKEILQIFPNYPNITFQEFISFRSEFSLYKKQAWIQHYPTRLNPSSISLVLFFSKKPFELLSNWNKDSQNIFLKELSQIKFLKTEHLNSDLFSMLLQYDYKWSEIEFIYSKGKENISKPKGKSYLSYYSKELIETIKQREALFFSAFPEYSAFGGDKV